jgi:hypothetical protein
MKRHGLDSISLLFGSVFFLIGGIFLVGGTAVPGSRVGALWPIPVIVLGLMMGLIGARAVTKESPKEGPPVKASLHYSGSGPDS